MNVLLLDGQRHQCVYISCKTMMLRFQIEPSDLESSLTLSDLSPDDNGRVIICSAENMVGQTEATLQLNILCKEFSIIADCKH